MPTRGDVTVTVQIQNPVICGRNKEPRRTDTVELRVRTATWYQFLCSAVHTETASHLSSRQVRAGRAIQMWLQTLLKSFTAQKPGQIEVYELQQEYKDYRMCWEEIRKGPCCSTEASGLAHYTAQHWAVEAKRHVEWTLYHGGNHRLTLFVTGQKGSGKTHFVEWLAGEFGAPVYYNDLSNPTVNDETLRGCVARNRMIHAPPILVHIDEFQAPLRSWMQCEEGKRTNNGVTIQGLQTLLEGISTPKGVVFIITSSAPLPTIDSTEFKNTQAYMQDELQGLLRRIQCRYAIPCLDMDTANAFLSNFHNSYAEGKPEEELLKKFAEAWCYWDEDVGVPFDMFSKYLEQSVRKVYVGDERSQQHKLKTAGAYVPDYAPFLKDVLDADAVKLFAEKYAGGAYHSKFLACYERGDR